MMKTRILLIALIFGTFAFTSANAGTKENIQTAIVQQTDSTTFKVYGKCGMCKNRIEGAVNELEGVQSANWDVESKMLTVEYDPSKVEEMDIHKQIASVGHDTEKVKASDEDYKGLMGCCKYKRSES